MVWVYLCLIKFTKGGYVKCDIFLISKGSKIKFTHIIVNQMGKQHGESLKERRLHYCIIGRNV